MARVSIDWLTENFSKITGYEVQEIVGEHDPLRIYVYPHDLDRLRETFRTSTSQGPISYEFRIIRKDGSIHWLWSHAYPVFSAQGQLIRMHGATQDITERKQAEAALQESNRRLEDALATLQATQQQALQQERLAE